MTDDLVAFLRARLDEDEQTARAAAEPERWAELNRQPRPQWYVQLWADPDRTAVIADPESSAFPVVVSIEGMDEDDAQNRVEHIARHDPARVLREIEAKRLRINAHSRPHECIELTGSGERSVVDGRLWELWEPQHTEDNGPCFVLRTEALPYADHPDCREHWRP